MRLINDTIINDVVLPALTALWKYFGEDITTVVKDVSTLVDDFAEKALKKIKTVWEEDVKGALGDMRDLHQRRPYPRIRRSLRDAPRENRSP